MKRVLSFIIILCIIVCTVTASLTLTASAASIKPKKIISVVYDDSGSMFDEHDTWEYASYGIQTFAGLLGDDDIFFVTYMSEPEKYIQYDVGSRQDTIDTIRSHSTSNETPASSIITANAALIDYYTENGSDSDEYWLIVFTDGDLNDADSVEGVVSDMRKNDERLGFSLNNIYFPLGEYAVIRDPVIPDIDVYDKDSDGTPDIIENGDEFIDALGKEADRISGRMRVKKTDIKLQGDKTLTFSSALPLYSIEVLSQKSKAGVVSVACPEADLKIVSNVSVEAPDKLSDSLTGTAALINNGNDNIPASSYTIEFSDKIDLDSVVIMIEPAVGIKLTITRDGQTADPSGMFTVDEMLNLEGTVVESGTDKPIDLSLLPSGTTFETGFRTSGNRDSTLTLSYDEIQLTLSETELYTSVILPGFLPIKDSVTIQPQELPVYTITASSDSYSVTQSALRNKDAEPLIFTVYLDGERLSYDEVEKLPFRIENGNPLWNGLFVGGTTEILPDGSIAFTPEYKNGFAAWCLSFATLPFGNSVKAVIGESESDKVPMSIWWAFPLDFILNFTQILVLIYLIHLLVKAKFPFFGKLKLMKIVYNNFDDSEGVVSHSTKSIRNFPWVFIPSKRTRINLKSGITMKASGFRNDWVDMTFQKKTGVAYSVDLIELEPENLKNKVNIAAEPIPSAKKKKKETIEKNVRRGKALYRINIASKSLVAYGIRAKKN